MRTLVRFAFSLVLALLALPLTAAAQTALGTAFTYQGQLLQNNAPVTGSTDMTFTLWDAATGGNPIGAALPFTAGNGNPVSVQNGIFTVALDFGPTAFNTLISDERWLAVTIGSTALSPRTKIENAPYALQSRAAELAYSVSNNSIGSAQIIATQVQRRVSGSCAAGSAISVINQDGTVSCQSDGGTITGVTPASGSGLTGGGTSGSVSVGTDLTVLQKRVAGTCSSGSAISTINQDGTVTCQSSGTGTVTGVAAGRGLAASGPSTSPTLGISDPLVLSGSNSSGVIAVTSSNGFSSGAINSTAPDHAIVGAATGSAGYGVEGSGFHGVQGVAPANAVGGYGVAGYSMETTTSVSSFPPQGAPAGVYGVSSAPSGIGVHGVGNLPASSNARDYGVLGEVSGANGYGVAGVSPFTGVAGFAQNAGGYGVYGSGSSGVYGASSSGTAVIADGTYFGTANTRGLAAYGSPAGFFQGQVAINSAAHPGVELTIAGSDPNADLTLQVYNASTGINLSVDSNANFYIQSTNGYATLLGVDQSGNLTITGASAYKPGGGAWAAPSDARLKRDIQPLDHVLDKLLHLRGVTFEYAHPDSYLHPAGRHTGFIAQEVQLVFPDWVGRTPDGYLSVGPQGFEAMTVEALRELRAEKDAEIADLRSRLDALSERMERMQAREAQP